MLAYRHAFHAGNHADVLKHMVYTMVLRHMNAKDKPYRVVDTHAGAGGYSLEGRYAQKKGEFEAGIARLWQRADLPTELADYIALVRSFNPQGRLEQYPGSPAFASMLLRPQDQLRAFELHPTDHRILASYLAAQPVRSEVYDVDGFDGRKRRANELERENDKRGGTRQEKRQHRPPPHEAATERRGRRKFGHGSYFVMCASSSHSDLSSMRDVSVNISAVSLSPNSSAASMPSRTPFAAVAKRSARAAISAGMSKTLLGNSSSAEPSAAWRTVPRATPPNAVARSAVSSIASSTCSASSSSS